jgi:hypothetical protein
MTLPEIEFYDPEEWSRDPEVATFGHTPLIPVVDHGPMSVYLRNVDEYVPVIMRQPHDKFAFSETDTRYKVRDPYVLLKPLLPAAINFEWIVVHRAFMEFQTRDAYEASEPARRVPLWNPRADPQMLMTWCEKAIEHGYSTIGVGWLSRMDKSRMDRIGEWLFRVTAAYPHIKFHFAFGASFRHMFGMNYASTDVNPVFSAKKGFIWLPNGRQISPANKKSELKWIHVLGFSSNDLQSVAGRTRFNIASALWAAENYRKAEPISAYKAAQRDDPLRLMTTKLEKRERGALRTFKPTLKQRIGSPFLNPDKFPQSSPDIEEPYDYAFPVTMAQPIPVRPKDGGETDKILCNSCSLAPTCKVFREGAICAVTDSPTSKLAAMLGTRDTETIKGVLGEIISKQVERYERSAEKFREDDESDVLDLRRSEHLMKMENSLVRSTETFMKILDPKFRESNIPAIQANTTNIYNPRVLVADVVRQLEEKGYDRSQITPDLIAEVTGQTQRVIEG